MSLIDTSCKDFSQFSSTFVFCFSNHNQETDLCFSLNGFLDGNSTFAGMKEEDEGLPKASLEQRDTWFDGA